MVTPKAKQWFGAEIPWANYERYIKYVRAHIATKMTIGMLIVAAVDAHLARHPQNLEERQPKQPEAPPKASKPEPKSQKAVNLEEAKVVAERLAPPKVEAGKVTKLAPGEGA